MACSGRLANMRLEDGSHLSFNAAGKKGENRAAAGMARCAHVRTRAFDFAGGPSVSFA